MGCENHYNNSHRLNDYNFSAPAIGLLTDRLPLRYIYFIVTSLMLTAHITGAFAPNFPVLVVGYSALSGKY